jgi:outer membrane lipoprotein-sorting protein
MRRRKKTKKRTQATRPPRTRSLPALAVGVALAASLSVPFAVRPSAAAGTDRPAAKVSTTSPTAQELIDDVISRYESAASYRLTFTQQNYWALADTTFSSDGVLLLQHPSLLSIRYDDGSRIVADGESLWVYVAQTNQFLATAIDSSDVILDPPRLLGQYVPDAKGRFPTPTSAMPEGAPADAAPALALSLKPGGDLGEPAALDVYIDARTFLVRQLVARARSGDYTLYTIRSTEVDAPASTSDFTLRRPPGAELLTGESAGLR